MQSANDKLLPVNVLKLNTAALMQTGLPSSSTAVYNFTWRFKEMMLACDNAVVSAVSSLCF